MKQNLSNPSTLMNQGIVVIKKNAKCLLVALLVSLALTSCQIAGLTPGYNLLTEKGKEYVIPYQGEFDSIKDYSKIYVINAYQVKDYIRTHEKVLIYDYTPFCTSKNCILPQRLVAAGKAAGVDVLVISNILCDIFRATNSGFPVFMIDHKSCYTKWRGKYIDRFYYAITGKTQEEMNDNAYLYFYKGAFQEHFNNPQDIPFISLSPKSSK